MRSTRQTRNAPKPTGLVREVLTDIFRLAIFGFLGAMFFLVRYILRTPQPLRSVLPGEERLYHWTHGHVFYKVLGVQDAPPLVLVHAPELAASSYEMRGIMEQLAQHYRVYALDLLGFGLSDHPHISYTGGMYVALLQDFLSHVVARSATIVASGLSANYAIALASEMPTHCERLVLLSPIGLFTNGKPQQWYTPLLRNPLIGLCLYACMTTRIVLQGILTRGTTQGVDALSSSELDYSFAAAHQFGAEHPVLAYMRGDLALDISCQLKTVQQPVLVIWGLHALHSATDGRKYAPLQSFGGKNSSINAMASARSVVLLTDMGRHIQETQAKVVASHILALPRSGTGNMTPKLADTATQEPMEEFGAGRYTEKEESSSSVSSLSDALPQAHRDTNTLETIEPMGEQQELQAAKRAQESETVKTQPVDAIEAYCVKCKQKRAMNNPTDTTTKNGRRAKEGTCPVCGTRLFRFIAG